MFETQIVYSYPSVHTHQTSDLRQVIDLMVETLDDPRDTQETELDQINYEELNRLKQRANHFREYQKDRIEKLSLKKKLRHLRTEVKSLKVEWLGQRKQKRHSVEGQQSTLERELEVKKRMFKEQKHRKVLQERQIEKIKRALQDLEGHIERSDMYHGREEEMSIGVRFKLLQNKKKLLAQANEELNAGYEQQMRRTVDKLANIEEASLERQLLERRIEEDLHVQMKLLKFLNENQRTTQASSRDSQSLFDLNPKKRTLTRQIEEGPPSNLHRSIHNLSVPRRQESRNHKTLSLESTPSIQRPPNSTILEKRRSFRSPINLTPTKYKINEMLGHKYTKEALSQSTILKDAKMRKKNSIALSSVSEIKLVDNSNLDVSLSVSGFQRSYKGIEMVAERIVELETINEEGRNRQVVINNFGESSNNSQRKRNRSNTTRKQPYFKPSGSETTKSDLFQHIKPLQKGIPFEINEDSSLSESIPNANLISTLSPLSPKIPHRFLKRQTLDLDQSL